MSKGTRGRKRKSTQDDVVSQDTTDAIVVSKSDLKALISDVVDERIAHLRQPPSEPQPTSSDPKPQPGTSQDTTHASDLSDDNNSDQEVQLPRSSETKGRSRRSPGNDVIEYDSNDEDDDDYDDDDTTFSAPIHCPTTSFGMMVGQTVCSKLKKKILLNKFVEMAELLPAYKFKRTEEYNMKMTAKQGTTFIRSRPKHDLSILQWVEAFA
jgi:hypothetical protein